MKQSVLRRVLSVLLCVSLLLGVSVARPQKVEAVAVTASVVAAVAAIMTACGISYWAATQDDAIEYLGGKIDRYLYELADGGPVMSYEDWLGVDSVAQLFDVTANGAMRVGGAAIHRILSFVSWFNEETVKPANGQRITAGGSDVEMYINLKAGHETTDNPTCNVTQDGDVAFTFYGSGLSTQYSKYVGIRVPRQAQSVTVQVDSLYGYYPDLWWSVTSQGSGSNFGGMIGGASYGVCAEGKSKTLTFIGSSELVFIQFAGLDPDTAYAFGCLLTFSWTDNPLLPDNVALQPAALSLAIPTVADDESLDVLPNVPLLPTMSVEQATDAILGGVASEEGLTSEVDSGSQGGILEGWDWLSNILGSIRDFIAGIAQTVLGIPEAIGQAAQDVITGIQSIPGMISDALVNLFVPDEAFIGEFVASLHGIFDNRFSILSYPFSILGEFITRASGIDEDEPILRWPDIYEPFSGQLLIGAGSYNLNNIRQGNFAQAHGLYMVVVKGWIAFEFLGYLYSWFCSVFKMREDDFVSPLEAYDGGDNG